MVLFHNHLFHFVHAILNKFSSFWLILVTSSIVQQFILIALVGLGEGLGQFQQSSNNFISSGASFIDVTSSDLEYKGL